MPSNQPHKPPPPPPRPSRIVLNPANAHAFNRQALKPFHSKPAASRAVYYKKASAELPPWRGVRVDCFSYPTTLGGGTTSAAATAVAAFTFTSSVKNVKNIDFYNGITSNTAIKTISKSINSAHYTPLTTILNLGLVRLRSPDCLHPIKIASISRSGFVALKADGGGANSSLLRPPSHMNQNATKYIHPKAPKPLTCSPTTIPEVTLKNIKLALLPTVKFHHNSNNIDNNNKQQQR